MRTSEQSETYENQYYEDFLLEKILEIKLQESFHTFLMGSSKKITNESIVKFLPKDVLHMIWIEYAISNYSDLSLVNLGLLEILKIKKQRYGKIINIYNLVQESIFRDRFDIFEWLLNNCTSEIAVDRRTIRLAIKTHSQGRHYLDWFKQNGKLPSSYHFNMGGMYFDAITANNIEAVKWVHENTQDVITTDVLCLCCTNGNTDMLDVLFSYGIETNIIDISRFLQIASSNNHINVIKWIVKHYSNQVCICDTIYWASLYSKLDIMKWVYKNESTYFVKCQNRHNCQCPNIDNIMYTGEMYSSLCYKNGKPQDVFDTIKWIYQIYGHYKISQTTINCASKIFNLDMLIWLHENIPEFNPKSSKYLGCSKDALFNAIKYNNIKMIDWLIKNRPEFDPNSKKYIGYLNMINVACETGELEKVKYVKKLCKIFDITSALYTAYQSEKFEIANWLYKNRTQFPDIDIDQIEKFFYVKVDLYITLANLK